MRWLIIPLMLLMVSPVMGETFGWLSQGTSCLGSNQAENDILSDTCTISEDGYATSIHWYGANDLSSGTNNWKGALYAYSDGSLICTTLVTAIGDSGATGKWFHMEFADTVQLTSGTNYLLSIWCEDVGGNCYVCCSSAVTINAFHDDETFGAWPGTHAKTARTYRNWDIYVTYTPGAIPVSNPGQVIIIGAICLDIWRYLFY